MAGVDADALEVVAHVAAEAVRVVHLLARRKREERAGNHPAGKAAAWTPHAMMPTARRATWAAANSVRRRPTEAAHHGLLIAGSKGGLCLGDQRDTSAQF